MEEKLNKRRIKMEWYDYWTQEELEKWIIAKEFYLSQDLQQCGQDKHDWKKQIEELQKIIENKKGSIK